MDRVLKQRFETPGYDALAAAWKDHATSNPDQTPAKLLYKLEDDENFIVDRMPTIEPIVVHTNGSAKQVLAEVERAIRDIERDEDEFVIGLCTSAKTAGLAKCLEQSLCIPALRTKTQVKSFLHTNECDGVLVLQHENNPIHKTVYDALVSIKEAGTPVYRLCIIEQKQDIVHCIGYDLPLDTMWQTSELGLAASSPIFSLWDISVVRVFQDAHFLMLHTTDEVEEEAEAIVLQYTMPALESRQVQALVSLLKEQAISVYKLLILLVGFITFDTHKKHIPSSAFAFDEPEEELGSKKDGESELAEDHLPAAALALATTKLDAGEECTVCLDGISTPPAGVLICGHVYHEDCIRTWFRMRNSCPQCRKTAQKVYSLNSFRHDPILTTSTTRIDFIQEHIRAHASGRAKVLWVVHNPMFGKVMHKLLFGKTCSVSSVLDQRDRDNCIVNTQEMAEQDNVLLTEAKLRMWSNERCDHVYVVVMDMMVHQQSLNRLVHSLSGDVSVLRPIAGNSIEGKITAGGTLFINDFQQLLSTCMVCDVEPVDNYYKYWGGRCVSGAGGIMDDPSMYMSDNDDDL